MLLYSVTLLITKMMMMMKSPRHKKLRLGINPALQNNNFLLGNVEIPGSNSPPYHQINLS